LHYLIRKHFGASNRRVQVIKSRDALHVRTLAQRAAQDGFEMVVAVGGDGTVNMAAQGILLSETALAVLPTGSGNGYARNVGIPLRLEKALALLKEPYSLQIDVGSVDDRIFLVSCGIGWEAVIATVFEESLLRGVLPYATAALTTYLQYEPQEIAIEAEPGGWTYRGRPMLFSVTNMREYGVGVTIAPTASERDGLLDICLIPRHSLLNVAKYTPEMFRQRTALIPGYVHQLASQVKIQRAYPGNIHLDGTPFPFGEEIKIHILPTALKVVVNPDNYG